MPLKMLFLCALLAASPAYAYLDPATGSIILQALIGGVAVALGVMKMYWARIKGFFQRSSRRDEKQG